MSIVKQLIGGYLGLWVLSMVSMFLMVLVAFLISALTNDATIIQLMYFIYNGTMSIFIVILAAPIGFCGVFLIPVWNGVNDFIAPLLAVIIDPIFGGLASLTGADYTSFAVSGDHDQSVVDFTLAFGNLLTSFTEFLMDEVVGA